MELKQITYKPTFFELLQHLTSVHVDIPIFKEGNVVVAKKTNKSKTIAYELRVAKTTFNYEVSGDKIAFQNFPEFYSLYRMMPSNSDVFVSDDVDTLIVRSGKSEVSFNLGLADAISPDFNKVPMKEGNYYSFNFPFSIVSKIRKVLSTIAGRDEDKRVQFILGNGTELGIKVFATSHNNVWSDRISDVDFKSVDIGENEFNLTSELFKLLPDLGDAFTSTCTIDSNGVFKFSFASKDSDEFLLDIHSSRIR